MHEFYERSRRKTRFQFPLKTFVFAVAALALAIAAWKFMPGSRVYEDFEMHGGPVVTDVATNPSIVVLTSHRETQRITTGRNATYAYNYSDLHWDLFAFNAKDLSKRWITRLTTIRRGARNIQAAIIGVSNNTVWVFADGLAGVSLSDGEVIGDAESIEALNPQLRGVMPSSRKQIYFDNGLMIVAADGRSWRINNETLRATLDTSSTPVKSSLLGEPISRGTDSMNVLPIVLHTQYQSFKTRSFVVGDTWYGMMHASEVEQQRRDPHTQDFNSAIRFRLWSTPLRDTLDRMRNPARLPLDFKPIDASPEFLRGGLLSVPDASGRERVVGIANPTRFIVVHQDRIDRDAKQSLTCLALDGRACWDAPLEMRVATGFALLSRARAEDWALIVTGLAPSTSGDLMTDSSGDDMPVLARVNIADGRVTRFRFAEVDFKALDGELTPYRSRTLDKNQR